MRYRLGLAGLWLALIAFVAWNSTFPGTTFRSMVDTSQMPFPPVTRNAKESQFAWRSVVTALEIEKVTNRDAWAEPNCDSVGVFLRTESGSVWALVDRRHGQLISYIREKNVLEAIALTKVKLDPSILGDYHTNGPGGRPWYMLGVSKSSGNKILLRFKTEECSFQQAELQEVASGGVEVATYDITLSPYWVKTEEPNVALQRRQGRDPKQTAVAYRAAERFTGIEGDYVRDAWIVPACDAIVVYQQADGKTVWTLFDRNTGQIREMLLGDEVLAAVKAELGEHYVQFSEPLQARMYGSRSSPRYEVGYMTDIPSGVWVHLMITDRCSLHSFVTEVERGFRYLSAWDVGDLLDP